MFGIIILLIGVAFLLQNLGIITANFWQILWPLFIILIGLSIIFRRKHCWCCGGHHKNKEEWHKFGDHMHEKFGGHHEHDDGGKDEEEHKAE